MKTKTLELVRKDTFVVTQCHLLAGCTEKINLLSVIRIKSNLLRRLRPSDQGSFKKVILEVMLAVLALSVKKATKVLHKNTCPITNYP